MISHSLAVQIRTHVPGCTNQERDLQHHESNMELHMNATYLRLGAGPKEVPWLLWTSLRGLWYKNQLWFLKTTLAPIATRNSVSWHISQCVYKLQMPEGHIDQQNHTSEGTKIQNQGHCLAAVSASFTDDSHKMYQPGPEGTSKGQQCRKEAGQATCVAAASLYQLLLWE